MRIQGMSETKGIDKCLRYYNIDSSRISRAIEITAITVDPARRPYLPIDRIKKAEYLDETFTPKSQLTLCYEIINTATSRGVDFVYFLLSCLEEDLKRRSRAARCALAYLLS